MWLLNAKTRTLQQLHDDAARLAGYAILSHTWAEEEVTFRDIQHGDVAETLIGYVKIRYACRQAVCDGLPFVWVDTCCINKESSAELSEAINSMFKWYQQAAACYAFLPDVPVEELRGQKHVKVDFAAFSRARWFSRGWTLQELLAPSNLQFFGQDWKLIDSKARLAEILHRVTGIDIVVLTHADSLSNASVAKRMSWAAGRETTRPEDRAYSLLGVFGINMPLLYGEGDRAFHRLQKAIIETSTDHSVFLWQDADARVHGSTLLAQSPDNFRNSGKIIRYRGGSEQPFEVTNSGLRISLPIIELRLARQPEMAHVDGQQAKEKTEHLAIVNCRYEDDFRGLLALRLQDSAPDLPGIRSGPHVDTKDWVVDLGPRQFEVIPVDYLQQAITRSLMIIVSPPFDFSVGRTLDLSRSINFCIVFSDAILRNVRITKAHPPERWNPGSYVFRWSPGAPDRARGHLVWQLSGSDIDIVLMVEGAIETNDLRYNTKHTGFWVNACTTTERFAAMDRDKLKPIRYTSESDFTDDDLLHIQTLPVRVRQYDTDSRGRSYRKQDIVVEVEIRAGPVIRLDELVCMVNVDYRAAMPSKRLSLPDDVGRRRRRSRESAHS